MIWALQILGYQNTFVLGILQIAAAAPNVLGAYHYIRYLMAQDDVERKNGTFKACLLVVLSNLLSMIVYLVTWLTASAYLFENFIVQEVVQAIFAVLFLYYAGACKKYVNMGMHM